MKVVILLLLVVALIVMPVTAHADYIWHDRSGGITDLNLESIAVNEGLILAGSSRSIFRSKDSGQTWQRVLSVHGADGGKVNQLVFSPANKSVVYAATSAGLFRSADQGSSWKKVFSGLGTEEKDVRSIAVDYQNPNHLYLACNSGVFISQNEGRTWQSNSEGLSGSGFRRIKINPHEANQLYLVGTNGIFFSDNKGINWMRVYSTGGQESLDNEEDGAPDADEAISPTLSINDIAFDPEIKQILYFATDRGVLARVEEDSQFKWLSHIGLGNLNLTSLLVTNQDEPKIIAASAKGVFAYDETNQTWNELYKGLILRKVAALAPADSSGDALWAVGEGGVFRANQVSPVEFSRVPGNPNQDRIFAGEPSIREVQEAAIRYAEVHPDKIKEWRKGALYRSFLPELSADYDKTVTYDSGSDVYHIGPYDWGVTLKWDLADLVWNPSQTSIDVRSRLMVQLRDDILDEVNRFYFERRRVKADLILNPPADKQELFELELRLEELTAGLDAMTGGWFSRQLR